MIGFKSRDDVAPSALILFAIVLMAGALVYMVAVPPPSTAGLARGRDRSRQKIETEIAQAKESAQQRQASALPRLWTGDADTVTATILAQLTHQANQRKLRLAAFRPQKLQWHEGITELPFSVQISGPYPAIRAVAAALDSPNAKLALRSIQIAGADGATNVVTATLTLSAYLLAPETGGAHG